MADLNNLGGVVGEILRDTRVVVDPWGFGFRAKVLRANHDDWTKLEMELAASTPEAERVRRATAENMFADFAPTAGFRAKKKQTKAEQHRALIDTVSERGRVLTQRDLLRQKKQGIASVLAREMMFQADTSVTRNGKTWDLATAEGRLALLDHETWQRRDGAEILNEAIPAFKRDLAGEVELDSAGEPVPHLYAGENIGDALAQWLLDEANYLAGFSEQREGEIVRFTRPTSDGSTGTGSSAELESDGRQRS